MRRPLTPQQRAAKAQILKQARAKLAQLRQDPAVRAKMSAASKAAWAATCVYCDARRSRHENDGPETWCCVDQLACERRITAAAAKPSIPGSLKGVAAAKAALGVA